MFALIDLGYWLLVLLVCALLDSEVGRALLLILVAGWLVSR